jgi:hypothetical protein
MQGRIECLKNVQWRYVTPAIVTAADAWTNRFKPARFYTVHWHGDQPICFTWIEFQTQIGDLFKARIKDGSPYGIYYLKATDLVLMFKDTT